jgi:hypothetical protein
MRVGPQASFASLASFSRLSSIVSPGAYRDTITGGGVDTLLVEILVGVFAAEFVEEGYEVMKAAAKAIY